MYTIEEEEGEEDGYVLIIHPHPPTSSPFPLLKATIIITTTTTTTPDPPASSPVHTQRTTRLTLTSRAGAGDGDGDGDERPARELAWLLSSLRATLAQLRHGLEECYALLAPVDPGSTLALTTPRHETVKGHVTRAGTRLVRGAVSLRLRTLAPLTLALSPARPLRLAPLQALHALLTRSVDLLRDLCGGGGGGGGGVVSADAGEKGAGREGEEDAAPHLAAQLRVLAQYLAEASRLIKGPPPFSSPSSSTAAASSSAPPPPDVSSSSTTTATTATTSTSASGTGGGWTTQSASLSHFYTPPPHATNSPHHHHHHKSSTGGGVGGGGSGGGSGGTAAAPEGPPPATRNISLYLTIEDASLVLYVRSLEPAGQPMNLGAKLAFAIGTARRLEHDEADRVFRYACDDESRPGADPGTTAGGGGGAAAGFLGVAGIGIGIGIGGSGNRSRPGSSHSAVVSTAGEEAKKKKMMMTTMTTEGDRRASASASASASSSSSSSYSYSSYAATCPPADERPRNNQVDVYVREKVRVESADPSLMSLSAKLGALSNTLALARRNLAAVMGEPFVDDAEGAGAAAVSP